jgi:hypothetical protein
MNGLVIQFQSEQYAELDAFLAERIYEFNAQALTSQPFQHRTSSG